MSEGRAFNGCTITGIGLDKVEQILYRAMVTYYVPSETFNQAYIAILQAAADLFSDADCLQVKKALQAVELDQQSPCSGGVERTPFMAESYGVTDLARALQISAGLVSAGADDIGRLDVALTGASFLRVEMKDAVTIGRKVAGLDQNP